MKTIEISKRGDTWHAHCLKSGRHIGEITEQQAKAYWTDTSAVFVREALKEMAAIDLATPNDKDLHPQRPAVVSLLLALQAAGFEPKSVNDGGGEWEETPTIEAAADAITAVDEANISFKDPAGGPAHTAFIVLGNGDWEIVNDFTDRDSETGKLFTATIYAWADAREEAEFGTADAQRK